jgi:hypothetical protein
MTHETSSAIARTGAAAEWTDIVRDKVFEVWAEQACPEHWPEVRQRLLEKLAPFVDDAVAELAWLFGDVPSADDPALAVWATFPKLDRDHCTRLAELLIQAREVPRQRKTAEGGKHAIRREQLT